MWTIYDKTGESILTELTSFKAIAWQDFKETRESSAPAMTNTGMSPTACNNDSAFLAERMVSEDNLPISWSASSHPSTDSGAYTHNNSHI